MGTWPEPAFRLTQLAGLLRGGGLIAIVSQPWCPGATAETTAAATRQLVELLETAGFVATRVETLRLEPPVACVIGTAPSDPRPTADIGPSTVAPGTSAAADSSAPTTSGH
jgi:hypothetical protein